jgi:hypothetical protein
MHTEAVTYPVPFSELSDPRRIVGRSESARSPAWQKLD